MKNRIWLWASSLGAYLSTLTIQAQQEFTLYHLNNVYQSTYSNPVSVPEYKFSFGLPGMSSVYGGGTSSSFRATDLLKKNSTGGYDIDPGQLIINNNLDAKSKNFFYAGAALDLFHVRFKVRSWFFSLGAQEKVDVRFSYPKDFISLLWFGNSQFVGNKADFTGIGINATHYRDFVAGFTRAKDGSKWIYGARFHLLFGQENLSVSKSDASLGVASQQSLYTLNLDSKITINTSGSTLLEDLSNGKELSSKDLMNFENKGYAIDGGVTYKANRNLSFTGVLNNLGFISWKKDVKNFSNNGTYDFYGIDFGALNDSNNNTNLEQYVDTISKRFAFTETQNSYKTNLTPQLFLTTTYQLSKNVKFSGTIYNEFYRGLRPGISLAYYQRAGRLFNFVFTYSALRRSYNNLGMGIVMKLWPVQWYLVGDNFFALANPFKATNFNVRTGINFIIHKVRKPDAQSHNDEKHRF